MVDRKFIVGAAIATGVVLLVPGVAPALARAARPLLKAAIKTGATAYEEFSRAGAETFEHIEDVVAEVRAEIEEEGVSAEEVAAEVATAASVARAANGGS